MPLYAGKYAICAFLKNMRNMLRSHDRYKPVSLDSQPSSSSLVQLMLLALV